MNGQPTIAIHIRNLFKSARQGGYSVLIERKAELDKGSKPCLL